LTDGDVDLEEIALMGGRRPDAGMGGIENKHSTAFIF
jgi:hypothetical protein